MPPRVGEGSRRIGHPGEASTSRVPSGGRSARRRPRLDARRARPGGLGWPQSACSPSASRSPCSRAVMSRPALAERADDARALLAHAAVACAQRALRLRPCAARSGSSCPRPERLEREHGGLAHARVRRRSSRRAASDVAAFEVVAGVHAAGARRAGARCPRRPTRARGAAAAAACARAARGSCGPAARRAAARRGRARPGAASRPATWPRACCARPRACPRAAPPPSRPPRRPCSAGAAARPTRARRRSRATPRRPSRATPSSTVVSDASSSRARAPSAAKPSVSRRFSASGADVHVGGSSAISSPGRSRTRARAAAARHLGAVLLGARDDGVPWREQSTSANSGRAARVAHGRDATVARGHALVAVEHDVARARARPIATPSAPGAPPSTVTSSLPSGCAWHSRMRTDPSASSSAREPPAWVRPRLRRPHGQRRCAASGLRCRPHLASLLRVSELAGSLKAGEEDVGFTQRT